MQRLINEIITINSLKIKSLFCSLVLLFSALPCQVQASSEKYSKNDISNLVNGCLLHYNKKHCYKLLIYIEALQIEESAQMNYVCQSRLLGLQSDLIMIMQDLGKSRLYKKNIQEVKDHCINF